jgi:hypothetical protein
MNLAHAFVKQMKEVPDDQKNNYEQLVGLLHQSFGHLDFWRLNEDWKMVKYEQVAHLILIMFNVDRPINERNKE